MRTAYYGTAPYPLPRRPAPRTRFPPQELSFDPPELGEHFAWLDTCIDSYTAGPNCRKYWE